ASAPARIFIDLQSGGADEIAAAINEHPVAPTVGPKPDRAPEITVPVVVADDVKADRMAAAPVQVASTEAVALPETAVAPASSAATAMPRPPTKPDESDADIEEVAGTQIAALTVPALQPPAKPVAGADARIPTIVLDPGHGGKDPGAVGAN